MDSLAPHAQAIINFLLWAFMLAGGALVSVLVWIGLRVSAKLDSIDLRFKETNETWLAIERDIRSELKQHDRRLGRLEGAHEK